MNEEAKGWAALLLMALLTGGFLALVSCSQGAPRDVQLAVIEDSGAADGVD